MRKQKEMVEAFQLGHRDFMRNLHTSLDILDRDISEAKEVDTICTGEWCKAVEISIDELANYVYSLSEPRWASKKDSQNIRRMRTRIHDLYLKYRSVGGTSVH
jgi:hypothetical protein